MLGSQETADADASPRRATTPAPHHGLAVELGDGCLLVSQGTSQARTGIRVLDGDEQVVASSHECAGVHGESAAKGEAVAVGCQDGALVYDGQEITKVASPDADGRVSHLVGADSPPVVLGSCSTGGEDAGPPTRVSLLDTAGALVRSVAVVQPWQEPKDWQDPRPGVEVPGATACVTEPASSSVHAVDLATGEVVHSARLDVVPNETTAASGDVEDHEGHAHHDG